MLSIFSSSNPVGTHRFSLREPVETKKYYWMRVILPELAVKFLNDAKEIHSTHESPRCFLRCRWTVAVHHYENQFRPREQFHVLKRAAQNRARPKYCWCRWARGGLYYFFSLHPATDRCWVSRTLSWSNYGNLKTKCLYYRQIYDLNTIFIK